MRALIHDERVVITFDKWHIGRINAELLDLGIDYVVYPSQEADVLIINENTRIIPLVENYPPINRVIETYGGPEWVIEQDKVIANYHLVPLQLEIAKHNLLMNAASLRYKHQNSFIKIPMKYASVKNLPSELVLEKEFLPVAYMVTIQTDQITKSNLMVKYNAIGDKYVNWKFTHGWVSLGKDDIGYILNAMDKYIQKLFDIELELSNSINSATSLNDLLNIDIDGALSGAQYAE